MIIPHKSPRSPRSPRSPTTEGAHDPVVDSSSPPAVVEEQTETGEIANDNDDNDSAFDAGSVYSDTTSLISEITSYRHENNRRYHAYKDGQYWGPNDEQMNNQLDIAHHLYMLTMGNKLFLAPIGDHPQRVLDVGTGTGIWAIDFADQVRSDFELATGEL